MFLGSVPAYPLGPHAAGAGNIGAESAVHGCDIPVMARYNAQIGHDFARHRVAFAQVPVPNFAQRLSDFARGVVLQRRGHDVVARAQMFLGHTRKSFGNALEHIPVFT